MWMCQSGRLLLITNVLRLLDFFGDVTTVCGIQSLNDYLQDRSYIQGYSPSKADTNVFQSLARTPEDKFSHVLRWYNQIKSLSIDLQLTLSDGCSSLCPVPSNTKTEVQNSKASNEEADDEDEIDLFGSDDEEEDKEAARIREERLQAYAEKKSKKPGPIAKSSVMLDVKPWDDETDMKAMEDVVRSIKMDGLQWGASKLAPLAFGINKLSILCTVEDEKVSIDDLTEKICTFEDLVQSVDIAAFNKI
ncbi:elongation factor 1-beta'-like [Macrobrachium nipponense]|uniref:elongation factor 1-beta'-like n=1 Tax=Macrobrachium nipponense TaxID=159736 RepID=UPI0030C7FEEC